MRRGRRPAEAEGVEGLLGSPLAKERLGLILECLAGRLPVAAASERLGVGERRFQLLRRRCLQFALEGLEPRPAGRPRSPQGAGGRVAALEAEVRRLRVDLQAARVREEIALAVPQALHRARKKRPGRRCRRKKPAT